MNAGHLVVAFLLGVLATVAAEALWGHAKRKIRRGEW